MSVKERLFAFIKSSGLNVSAFEKHCGLANGYVNSIRRSVGPESIDKIKDKYPNLNELWLLHGVGEMLISNDKKDTTISITIPDYDKTIIKIKSTYVQRLTSIYQRDQQKSPGK